MAHTTTAVAVVPVRDYRTPAETTTQTTATKTPKITKITTKIRLIMATPTAAATITLVSGKRSQPLWTKTTTNIL